MSAQHERTKDQYDDKDTSSHTANYVIKLISTSTKTLEVNESFQ